MSDSVAPGSIEISECHLTWRWSRPARGSSRSYAARRLIARALDRQTNVSTSSLRCRRSGAGRRRSEGLERAMQQYRSLVRLVRRHHGEPSSVPAMKTACRAAMNAPCSISYGAIDVTPLRRTPASTRPRAYDYWVTCSSDAQEF